jgi:hypothetical protein
MYCGHLRSRARLRCCAFRRYTEWPKPQPERRFTLLYDKVYRQDILREAWQRVKLLRRRAVSGRSGTGTQEPAVRTALVSRVQYTEARTAGKTRPLVSQSIKINKCQ